MLSSAVKIIKILQARYIAAFAGGCVRDFLRKQKPEDYDIATNATPEQIKELFPDAEFVGESFGVSLVKMDGIGFEVSTFRSDGAYLDGRHPSSVRFVNSMKEDSDRRDFSINAMYWDPITDTIYDYHNGQFDLKNNLICFVGSPEDRIKEDRIRMIRAIRFSARFDMEITEKSFEAIFDMCSGIKDIPAERIGLEFSKMFEQVPAKNRGKMLEILRSSGLLEVLLPEVMIYKGCEQPPQFHPEGAKVKKIEFVDSPLEKLDPKNPDHFDKSKYILYPGDLWEHTKLVLEGLPEFSPADLIWAGLLHDVGKPVVANWVEEEQRWRFNKHDLAGAHLAKEILARFKYSNDFIGNVCDLVENHMRFMHTGKMKVAKLKRFLAKSNFRQHLDLHKADCYGSHGGLENYDFCIQKIEEWKNEGEKVVLPKPFVNGYDLLNMGFKQGPIFREILDEAMDMQLEGSSREEILEKIKEKQNVEGKEK